MIFIVHTMHDSGCYLKMGLPDAYDLSTLDGKKVLDVLSSEAELRIEFGMVNVNVDLSANAWSGPEAAVLYDEGRAVVAWT